MCMIHKIINHLTLSENLKHKLPPVHYCGLREITKNYTTNYLKHVMYTRG